MKPAKAEASTFSESNTSPWVLFTFFKLYIWYQIAQSMILCLECKTWFLTWRSNPLHQPYLIWKALPIFTVFVNFPLPAFNTSPRRLRLRRGCDEFRWRAIFLALSWDLRFVLCFLFQHSPFRKFLIDWNRKAHAYGSGFTAPFNNEINNRR